MDQPTVSGKAQLWTLDAAQLKKLFPKVKPPREFYFQNLKWKGVYLDHLKEQKKILHRGDIISMLPYGQDKDDTNKWVFDGEKIRELEMATCKGLLPLDFEVITEFPIDYWSESLDLPVVPYDFTEHHTEVEVEAIVEVESDQGNFFYFPFEHKGQQYKLVADFSFDVEREDPINAEDFLQKLDKADYYRIQPVYPLPTELQSNKPNQLYLRM